ncbi:NAD-dependent epimerase/dehydratase family protein [Pelagibacterium halotolerans]|uniref:UDP-glucose 4-epimerase n=1 Tax=Pelagibacterium halotolerans (strain DSM 22347 / JCM 15775 / CGMCC 1.7692 / B2) TaxID=1082931 RepID=G4RGV7_PELHB|nr:NAD(P)-dependent oxidoreductase [Pelagibacterium halotolerans]AEQ53110.1 UDP-glucose 4-epimerase [Pelagibacterium halotolerans B2]QJR17248.1 NAD(P)-dependent oxidoreductase [Pelagibacterium halotolerans]SEA98890.1 Nucleoside-diphosphate-sugar epimerase [Pelagibacterium halotolerans]
MTKKRALVFGGAGFIGSHLLKSLAESGDYDAIVSADIAEPRFRVDGVQYKHVDIRQPIADDICPDASEIYNLAAVHTTPGHEDWEYFYTNVLGATHCCDYARRVGCERVVFTSSISVYGASEELKDETSALEPDSAYGRSKLCAEEIHAQWLNEAPGTRRLIVARPAVIYGYTERGNFTRLAHAMAKKRFFFPGRKDTIKACGYVEDLVASFGFGLERNETHLIYNFAHMERYTSEDICDAFTDVADYGKVTLVVPMQLMMLGGLAFEVLGKLGLRTSINRPRIKKLYKSTNIVPQKLKDMGFGYRYDLKQSLERWLEMSGGAQFK